MFSLIRKHENIFNPGTLALAILFPVVMSAALFSSEAGMAISGILLAIVLFGLAFGLSFESFVRYSQYGLSRDHPVLNQTVSLVAVILPFGVLFFGPYPVLLSLAFMAYSKYRSPDSAAEKQLPVYKRKGTADVINFFLLLAILAMLFTFNSWIPAP